MKTFLLLGLGRLGSKLAKELSETGHEVMVVDRNEDRVNRVMPYVTSAKIGNAVDPDLLASLGVSNFDACFVTMHTDFQNSLEATYQLKELGAKMVVSRAESDTHEKFLLKNGADRVIYPEKQVAKWTAIKYISEDIGSFMELDGEHCILEVDVRDDWVGKRMDAIHIRKKYDINVLAIKKGDEMNMKIGPDTVFEEGDLMVVLGSIKKIKKCFKY